MTEVTSGPSGLRVGDLVRVRSLEEILATLDADGCLENLPFMPEMARYCNRTMRVFRRAHKTCDTIDGIGGRSVIGGAVHLVGARCTGEAHGGCHNSCMIFWKEAWLRRIDPGSSPAAEEPIGEVSEVAAAAARTPAHWTRVDAPADLPSPPTWRCQATEALEFSTPLSPYRLSQYLEDVTSRNVDLNELLAGLAHSFYRFLLGLGVGYRLIVYLHDFIQKRRGGVVHPYVGGTLEKTPVATLNLEVGELVRIKSFDQVIATLDARNKNRGLWFVPQEMGRFCGQRARVARRVERLINERTGAMMEMKTPAVVLENIWCTGRTVENRVFCPRASALFWREIWLERVEPEGQQAPRSSLRQDPR